jgi:hypothetical protein
VPALAEQEQARLRHRARGAALAALGVPQQAPGGPLGVRGLATQTVLEREPLACEAALRSLGSGRCAASAGMT